MQFEKSSLIVTMDDIFDSSNSEGLMWVMGLAIVGTVVEVEDEIEDEFVVTDAMEAKLWYHEQRNKENRVQLIERKNQKKEIPLFLQCDQYNYITELYYAYIRNQIERDWKRKLWRLL